MAILKYKKVCNVYCLMDGLGTRKCRILSFIHIPYFIFRKNIKNDRRHLVFTPAFTIIVLMHMHAAYASSKSVISLFYFKVRISEFKWSTFKMAEWVDPNLRCNFIVSSSRQMNINNKKKIIWNPLLFIEHMVV